MASFGQQIRSVKITDIEKIITESKTPLIINFWATWCQPCIEELSYFQAEVAKRKKDSVQLLLVSLDFAESFPTHISVFAKKRNIEVPIVWLNETNADYFCPKIDSKWSGAIPATFFVNNKTNFRMFFESQLSHSQLLAAIAQMITAAN
jgi:peroxiredoxin